MKDSDYQETAQRSLFGFTPSVTRQPFNVRKGRRWVHGFASPPYDGFAIIEDARTGFT